MSLAESVVCILISLYVKFVFLTSLLSFFYSLTFKINFHFSFKNRYFQIPYLPIFWISYFFPWFNATISFSFPSPIFMRLIIWIAMTNFFINTIRRSYFSQKIVCNKDEWKLMTKLMYDKIFNGNNVIKINQILNESSFS